MAIYSMHAQIIGGGRSAVACAAYRSGTKLTAAKDRVEHDYTRKAGIVHSEIALPQNAPDWMRDRQRLWDAVEAKETRADAQLARETVVALPVELSTEQQVELARSLAELLADRGMVVDWSIHDTGAGNPHVHLMSPLRAVDQDGLMPKTVTRYQCRVPGSGETRPMTSAEFRAAEGWEKVYAYRCGSDRAELTPSEAEGSERAWERVRKQPISASTKVAEWGKDEQGRSISWDDTRALEEQREAWADLANQALERAQAQARIDHRSYADQGLDLVPTQHEGPQVTAAEREAERRAAEEGRPYEPVTRVREANEAIREANRIQRAAERAIQAVQERFARAAEAVREQLERVRERVQTPSDAARAPEAPKTDPEPDQTQNKPLERVLEPQTLMELREAVSNLAIIPAESQARAERLWSQAREQAEPLEAEAKSLREQAEPLVKEAERLRESAEAMHGIRAMALKEPTLERARALEEQAKPLLDKADKLDARIEEVWGKTPSYDELEEQQCDLYHQVVEAVTKAVRELPEELLREVDHVIEPVREISRDNGEPGTVGQAHDLARSIRFERDEPEVERDQERDYGWDDVRRIERTWDR